MEDAPTTAACIHHWLLGAPGDDMIEGRCKRCGAMRQYPASVEQATRVASDREAASIVQTVKLLPDFEPEPLAALAVA
ncbi:MAG: hypothetical protein IVW36_05350 [Dehalococcoidia bacterium]|nr:hypothetical protein [Dehalococcoidia bacterium]